MSAKSDEPEARKCTEGTSPPEPTLAKLQADVDRLSEAFDTNTQVFSESMFYADAMLWVLRAALEDLVNGAAKVREVEGRKVLDLIAYLDQYRAHATADEEPPLVTPYPADDTVIFGGR